MKVLFIGNSYTNVNDMPEIFKDIVLSSKKEIEVCKITRNGAALDGFSNPDTMSGRKVYLELSKGYDFCFLQEQSNRPVVGKEKFYEAVKKLNDDLAKNNTKLVLYETWTKANGHHDLVKYKLNSETMHEKLVQSYEELGDMISCKVSKVGRVFYYIYTHPELKMNPYSTDLSHPSVLGSYIIALTHYYTLFNTLDDVSYYYIFNKDILDKIKEIIIKAV